MQPDVLKRLLDGQQAIAQKGRHGFPVGLVVRIEFMFTGAISMIKDHHGVAWSVRLDGTFEGGQAGRDGICHLLLTVRFRDGLVDAPYDVQRINDQ